MKNFVFALLLTATFGLMAMTAFGQTTETLVVTSSNQQGWSFLSENTAGGSGAFVSGPSTPPLGSGSAQLALPAANNGYILWTGLYHGTRLADITELKYHTYGNSNVQAISLQFDVDDNGVDGDLGYQGRVVFEPYQMPGIVQANTWQEWDVLAGRWWATPGTNRPVSLICPQAAPCTTAALLQAFPNLRVFGRFLFKAGSNWAGFQGSVDSLKISIMTPDGVNTTTWDFEEFSAPTDPEDCKKGGYLLFNPPTGAYKNQGQCVSAAVPQ